MCCRGCGPGPEQEVHLGIEWLFLSRMGVCSFLKNFSVTFFSYNEAIAFVIKILFNQNKFDPVARK